MRLKLCLSVVGIMALGLAVPLVPAQEIRQRGTLTVPAGNFAGVGTELPGVALTAQGRLLAVPLADGTVRLWGGLLGRGKTTIQVDGAPIPALAFSPDGQSAIFLQNM